MRTLTVWGMGVLLIKAIVLGFGIAVILNFAANVIAIALEQGDRHAAKRNLH